MSGLRGRKRAFHVPRQAIGAEAATAKNCGIERRERQRELTGPPSETDNV